MNLGVSACRSMIVAESCTARASSEMCTSITTAPPARSCAQLEQRGDALAHADAHGGEPAARAATAHLVHQRGGDARARTAERVAERDRAAVHVDALDGDF